MFTSSIVPIPANAALLLPILFYPVLFNYIIPLAYLIAGLSTSIRPITFLKLGKDIQDVDIKSTANPEETATATKHSSTSEASEAFRTSVADLGD